MSETRILAVVVLYKQTIAGSETIASLARSFLAFPHLQDCTEVLLWDNSPEPLPAPATPFPSVYHHSPANVGLARAYNTAAGMAKQQGISWLLFLDQDTNLPNEFLDGILERACTLADREDIAAIVPAVFVGARQVSPLRMLRFRQEAYPQQEAGLAHGEAAAVNSGSLMRVDSLLRIGGYSEAFWLDYSDYYVYHQFFKHGLGVWRAADLRIQHSMTVLDYDNLMSESRYNNFIVAEGAFADLYKNRLENAVQCLRLLARTFRQRRRFKNPVFSRITFRYLLWRLAHRRRSRIAHWEHVTAGRLSSRP